MTDTVIKVHNLSKIYHLYDNHIDRLKETLHPFRKKYHHDFYALKDVNFEVKRGETIGIIGKNGSGKSTLLKILTKVLTPTSGNVEVRGRVSSLLELGAGFNPELTGLENVCFNGAIMGFTKDEIEAKLESILAFADIGDFIHQPVKTYSSGMQVRLAFAVAISIDPDILIVDEALAVGDMFFQAKCMTHMKHMMDRGVTLVFVSHDMTSIKSLCSKAILLEKGEIVICDTADKVVEKYFSIKVGSQQKIVEKTSSHDTSLHKHHIHSFFVKNHKFKEKAHFQRIQNGKAEFINIQILNENGNEIELASYNQAITLRMGIAVHEDIHLLAYGYHIRDKNGLDIVYSDSVIEDANLCNVKKGNKFIIDWKLKLPLIQDFYTVACVLSIPINLAISEVDFCDFVPIATQFQVEPRKESGIYGKVRLDNMVNIIAITEH